MYICNINRVDNRSHFINYISYLSCKHLIMVITQKSSVLYSSNKIGHSQLHLLDADHSCTSWLVTQCLVLEYHANVITKSNAHLIFSTP